MDEQKAPDAPVLRSEVRAIRDRPEAEVLIIGGGINGLSTFRDLALQGVDVILAERGDYASGASSASSHMIHGGIRYLENGEFRLVRESVQERNGLLTIAPHYVVPLPTTIPIFTTFSGIVSAPLRFLTHRQGKPAERGALLIELGLMLYDSFSRGGGAVPRHRFHGRRKSLAALPQLNRRVKYTATYFDGSLVNPERLALDVLSDAREEGANARAANYLEAVSATDGSVRLRDLVSGAEIDVRARVVVNTSGPWTDLTNSALGRRTAYTGGTKGSHIVLDSPELLRACAGRELFFENDDGRIVLIYPLLGRVLVGTTDIDADPAEPAVCTDEEVDYFFELIGHVFPEVVVSRDQIVYRFAGIRPLPRHEDTQPGFVSRDYRIVRDEVPALPGIAVLSLVGGKWTTFRALGEHLADEVLQAIGAQRRVTTRSRPIGGGRDFPSTPAARRDWVGKNATGVPAEQAEALLERYGTKAAGVISFIGEDVDTPLVSAPGYSTREIEYLARNEDVVHTADVLLRRTSLAFVGAVTPELIAEVSEVVARALDWSESRRREEIALCQRILASSHGARAAGEGVQEVD